MLQRIQGGEGHTQLCESEGKGEWWKTSHIKTIQPADGVSQSALAGRIVWRREPSIHIRNHSGWRRLRKVTATRWNQSEVPDDDQTAMIWRVNGGCLHSTWPNDVQWEPHRKSTAEFDEKDIGIRVCIPSWAPAGRSDGRQVPRVNQSQASHLLPLPPFALTRHQYGRHTGITLQNEKDIKHV